MKRYVLVDLASDGNVPWVDEKIDRDKRRIVQLDGTFDVVVDSDDLVDFEAGLNLLHYIPRNNSD